MIGFIDVGWSMNHSRAEWHELLHSNLLEFVRRSEREDTVLRMGPDSPGTKRPMGHSHLRTEAFLQLSGVTEFSFESSRLQLLPGELLIVPPRLTHEERVWALDEPFQNIVIYSDAGQLRCHIAVEQEGRPEIVHAERALSSRAETVALSLDEAAEVHSQMKQRAAHLCRSLTLVALTATELLLEGTRAKAVPEPPLVAKCKTMVRESLWDTELSVGLLARDVGCSANYLSHLFRCATGDPLISYINRLRLARAAELLRTTTLSSKEIAWACGFANPSYFIHLFRKRFEMTPLEYRAASERTIAKLNEIIAKRELS